MQSLAICFAMAAPRDVWREAGLTCRWRTSKVAPACQQQLAHLAHPECDDSKGNKGAY